MQSYHHFTLVERERLRIKLQEGKSLRKIARELGRNVSSISRELKRNGKKDGTYNAWWGCSLYLYRRKRCRRLFRISADPNLRNYICLCLDKRWSPEIIAAKWNENHPFDTISYSTIYSSIKAGRLSGYSRAKHLRRRYKRPRHGAFSLHPEHFIRDRPSVIDERSRLGDWEGDTVFGAIGKGSIVTCVDRKSRYLVTALLPDRTADTTLSVMCKALEGHVVHSLALDQGSEFAP